MQQKLYVNEEKTPGARILELLTEIALVATIGFFVSSYFFSSVSYKSRAMGKTIANDSTVFVNELSYALFSPSRYDVVAFKLESSQMAEGEIMIRRIIALPGDEIQILYGDVYVNGKKLDLSRYTSEITSDGIAHEPIQLRKDEYFLLGDEPANSGDSRSTSVGVVRKTQIIGRAWLYATSITNIHFVH